MLPCSNCGKILPLKSYFGKKKSKCRSCQKVVTVEYFAALFTPLSQGEKAQTLVVDEDASCFHHANKVAVAVCASCGIYICNLCEITKNEEKVCPGCFNKKADKSEDPITKEYVHHSTILGSLVLGSFLIYFVSVFTLPYAIYYGLKHRNDSEGFFRGHRTKMLYTWVGIAGAILICGLILIAVFAGS